MAKKQQKHYSLDNILARGAHYNVIIGERSNGKTYAVLEYGLKRFLETGEQMAIIRRWDTDFQGAQSARTSFDSLAFNGDGVNAIAQLSHDLYAGISYYAGRYYMTTLDEDGKEVRTDKCVAMAFAVNSAEHYKSASFPHITTILFDEFMSRDRYINDEFIKFQNLLSTIIRQRDNVKIFMCGNTVNKQDSTYFSEMGLHRIKKMRQGDIDVYTYGASPLRVAVEFSDSPSKSKPSDVYFAFDNPRLQMITGQGGVWEMDIYPHLPVKYLPKDVKFKFFIAYNQELLQGNIIVKDGAPFLYFHRKTTPLKDDPHDLIYSTEYSIKPNHRRNLMTRKFKVEQTIVELYNSDKAFYQDNEVGEIMRSYLQWCKNN